MLKQKIAGRRLMGWSFALAGELLTSVRFWHFGKKVLTQKQSNSPLSPLFLFFESRKSQIGSGLIIYVRSAV